MNNTAVNILYVSFGGQKQSFPLGRYTKVELLCCSFSDFPHHSGMLTYIGARHSLGFLWTCPRSSSLPGRTFGTDLSFFFCSL